MVDLEIEEGGIHIEWGVGGAHIVCSCLYTYSAQCSKRVWGHAPPSPRKILHLDHYESASEAVGDYHNHTQFTATGV